MQKSATFCDFFVIASGNSMRQACAIAKHIEEKMSGERIKPLSPVSANDESGWIVLDFVSVIAHIFYKPVRDSYALEKLWSDAKKVRIGRPTR